MKGWGVAPGKNLREGSKTFWAGNGDVRLAASVVAAGWNPDRGQGSGTRNDLCCSWAHNVLQYSQERFRMRCLFIESIGGNTEGQIRTSESGAHGDHAGRWKAAPDYGEQFKARHAGHVEVREDEIGNLLPDLG